MLSQAEDAGSSNSTSAPGMRSFRPTSVEAGVLVRSTTRVPPALVVAGLAGLLLASSLASALKQALPAARPKEAGFVQPEPQREPAHLTIRRTA